MDLKKKKQEAIMAYALAWRKARDSRDKNLVRKLAKLEEETEKLRIEVDKTMDPALKKEFDKAFQRYEEFFSHRRTSRKRPKPAFRRKS